MKNTVLLFVGILIIFGASFYIYLNESLASSNHGITLSKENQKEVSGILQDIQKELKPNYKIVSLGSKSKSKEIEVQVKGTQKYFDAVKEKIKNEVKEIVEETVLKEHTVIVTRWASQLSHLSHEERERGLKRRKELITLAKTLRKGLQDYDEVGEIGGHIDHPKETVTSITIETKIKGSEKQIDTKIKAIEGKVKEILNSPEVKSLSVMQTQSYDLNIKNTED